MPSPKPRSAEIAIHIMAWAVFVFLPIMVVPRRLWSIGNLDDSALVAFLLLSSIPLAATFYLHLLWMLPRFLARRKYLPYVASLLGAAISTLLFVEALYHLLPWVANLFDHHPAVLRRSTGYRTAVVSFVSFGLFAFRSWRSAEAERARSELALLKAQVNPHFLFNSLNSIYYLALQQSDKAPSAIEKLSAIMRYVIDEGSHDRVPLEREIAYLSDFIHLQRLRLPTEQQVHFSVTGDLLGKSIAPLILVTLLENAFKHGISTEHPAPIHIHLQVGSDQLRMEVVNALFTDRHHDPPGTGMGIENTRRRLALAYPGSHTLHMGPNGTLFKAVLTLTL